MADETHGIEIEIDSKPAESGKERVVRSLDDIKKKLDQINQTGKDSGDRLVQAMDRVAASSDKLVRRMDRIQRTITTIARAGRDSSSAFDQLTSRMAAAEKKAERLARELDQVKRQVDQLRSRLDSMDGRGLDRATRSVGMMSNAFSGLRGIIAGISLIAFTKSIVDTEAQFRGFNQSLKIITGSQAGANAELGFSTKVATDLGLRIKDLTQSYIGLLAASRGTTLEGQKSRDVFQSITKASVAYGLSNEQIQGALLAVQQMMSKGNVQAEELRGQLGERLPGAFQVAARAMGVTTAALSKMLEQGQVVADDFLPKFAAQLNKEIPNGVKSSYAGFNEFLNQLDRTKMILAQSGLFDALADGARSLADALKQLSDNGSLKLFASALAGIIQFLASNIQLLEAAAIAYGVYLAAVKVGVLIQFVQQLMLLERALGATTAASALAGVAMKGFQAVLATVLSTAALVTAGIAALVYAFISISNSGSQTAQTLSTVDDQLKKATHQLDVAKERSEMAASGVGGLGGEAAGAVQKIDSFAGAVGNAAQKLWEMAKARQAAALSDLVAQRNQAAATYNQLNSQTEQGTERRRQGINARVGQARGLRKVGAIVQGFGDILGVARDNAARNLGFGPSQEELEKGMAQSKRTVQTLDEAIKQTRASLEQFVTAQDRAAAAAGQSVKPNRALANALAQQQGAVTDVQKATRGSTKALAEHRKMLSEAEASERRRQQITDRYDDQPRYLDQADKDLQALDDMVGKWIKVGDAVVRYTSAMRDADASKIRNGMTRPFQEMLDDGKAELAQMALVLQGRRAEAEVLRQKLEYERRYGEMLPGQYTELLKQARAYEMMNRLLEDQQRIVSNYVQAVDEVRGAFEQLLQEFAKNPFKATGDFIKSLGQSLKNMWVRSISESVFGGLDREIEDFVTGRSGVNAAVDHLATQTTEAGDAAEGLAEELRGAARMIRESMQVDPANFSLSPSGGQPQPTGASALAATVSSVLPLVANDNEDIVVTGRREQPGAGGFDGLRDPGPTAVMNRIVERLIGKGGSSLTKLYQMMPKSVQSALKGVGRTIEGGLNKLGIKLPKGLQGISGAVTKGLQGAGTGMIASGIVQQLGIKQSSTSAAIGGAVGSFLPIPGGSIIGGLVGGTIGGLFKKTKKGSTTLSSATDDINASGSKGQKAAVTGVAKNVQSGLLQIAQQLGGMATGSFNVSIGQRKDEFRVGVNGQSTTAKKTSAAKFKDEGEAVAYAIQQAVRQGAIQGITEASQRVLGNAKNFDLASQAAVTYEDLVRQAARLRDPLKGTFDDIKRGMDLTLSQLKQAGYSASDLAQIEVVFREQQKDALKQLTSGYKDFLDSITNGADSGKTIYQQFLDAQAEFARVKSDLAAGTATQDEFTSAGQKLFDLARQVYGSSTPEFEAIKATLVEATQNAIKNVEAAADMSGVVTAVQTAAATAEAQRNEQTAILERIAQAMGAANGAAGYYAPATAAGRQAY